MRADAGAPGLRSPRRLWRWEVFSQARPRPRRPSVHHPPGDSRHSSVVAEALGHAETPYLVLTCPAPSASSQSCLRSLRAAPAHPPGYFHSVLPLLSLSECRSGLLLQSALLPSSVPTGGFCSAQTRSPQLQTLPPRPQG